MKGTEATWVKRLCLILVFPFLSQSVQPMAFGFTRPQAPSMLTKGSQLSIPTNPSANRLSARVSLLVDQVKEKFKNLDQFPNLQDLTPLHNDNPTSWLYKNQRNRLLTKSPPYQYSFSQKGRWESCVSLECCGWSGWVVC